MEDVLCTVRSKEFAVINSNSPERLINELDTLAEPGPLSLYDLALLDPSDVEDRGLLFS